MIEDNEAIVKANAAIRQFEIVDWLTRKARVDEIFKIVAPVAKAPSERKGQVDFLQQLITRHQGIQHMPWIAKLLVRPISRFESTSRALRTERQKGLCGQDRIARLRGVKEGTAQQHQPRLRVAEEFHKRLRGVERCNFLDC